MIEFRCNSYHKPDNTPIVSDNAIREYAEAILGDYKPELLREPGKISGERFLENYLGATMDYQDIYYDEGKDPIAGATVFNDDKVWVFDRENQRIKELDVCANTIIIDNDTMQKGKEGFSLFTHLHEGGHLCIHPCVYRNTEGQMTLFDIDAKTLNGEGHVALCKRSSIGGKKGKLFTQEDFREHQANVFAATLAMPRSTFIPTAQYFIRQSNIGNYRDVIVEPDNGWDLMYENEKLIITEALANVFGVSKSAAEVQLKCLGLMMTEEQYSDQYSQMSVAF